ncbi:MAG: thymidine phosphorylase, partial [Clostridia bacterium]
TLIVLPILVANGFICGKMSGRGLGFTGGTLDKIQSVPNVDVNIDKQQFFEQIKCIGVALAGQTANLCPADKKLYALRDVTATVDNVGLIAASIMSKKLAAGAHNIVLDVKCGKGAFMTDIVAATQLAELMVKIGKFAERNISAIITDMNLPLSRFVGNSLEVLGAIRVLKNVEKGDLYDVAIALASQLMKSCGIDDAENKAKWAVDSGEALKIFVKMMRAQGAVENFEMNEESLFDSKFCYNYVATQNGFVEDIDALKIAKIVAQLGGGRQKIDDVIDYKVGVEIVKTQSEQVENGDVVAKVFYSNEKQIDIAKTIVEAFRISSKNVKKAKRILKIVG